MHTGLNFNGIKIPNLVFQHKELGLIFSTDLYSKVSYVPNGYKVKAFRYPWKEEIILSYDGRILISDDRWEIPMLILEKVQPIKPIETREPIIAYNTICSTEAYPNPVYLPDGYKLLGYRFAGGSENWLSQSGAILNGPTYSNVLVVKKIGIASTSSRVESGSEKKFEFVGFKKPEIGEWVIRAHSMYRVDTPWPGYSRYCFKEVK